MFDTEFRYFKTIRFSYNIFDGNRFNMSISIFRFFPTTQLRVLKLLKLIESNVIAETAIEDFRFINHELVYASLYGKYFFTDFNEKQLKRNIKLIERKLIEWQEL